MREQSSGAGSDAAFLIAGPTASGKSALALALAERTGGVVINVDSMQVYAVLDRLTARPQADALARAPHYLYGHVHPATAYSTGAWLADVAALLARPELAGRARIFVGGTGLYFRALLGGLSEMPAIPGEIRAHWRARLEERGVEALHGELARRDPEGAAMLQPADRQRILRALEVLDATGQPIRAWQARPGRALIDARRARRILIEPDRALLAQRIELRLRAMIAEGAMEEVRALMALGLDPACPAMKAIGVRELHAADRGLMTIEEAIARAAAATRQYAKRQMSWFRHQAGPGWQRIAGPEDLDHEPGPLLPEA